MSTDLSGRAAIVTGGGRGIGRATALELARMGAAVMVADLGRDEGGRPTAQLVAREIADAGGRAEFATDTVTEEQPVERMVARTEEAFGSVDILVNNAGLAWQGQLWECDAESFERVLQSHTHGAFFCTKHAVLRMKERGWGRIVNLVSRAGITGLPDTIAYAVGKGGVLGLTNGASRDLGRLGITVNAVNPASTLTAMVEQGIAGYEQSGEEEGRQRAAMLRAAAQRPEQVAIVIAALCTEDAGHINGQVFLVERDRVGRFQPLTVVQDFGRGDDATVEEMAAGLAKLDYPDLSDPYGSG